MNGANEFINFIKIAVFSTAQHVGEVPAGREGRGHAGGLIADHHTDAIFFDIFAGFSHELHHFIVDGIHLGMEFQVKDPVAQVDERA